jgi:hypothetical protein
VNEVKEMHLTLNYIEVAASVDVPYSMEILPAPSSIGPGSVEMFHRFNVDSNGGTDLSPEQGLVHVWKKLVTLPNVALDADYKLFAGDNSLHSSAYLTFLTRFCQSAQEAGYKNINKHLLKKRPPDAWNTSHVLVSKKPSSPNKRKHTSDEDDSHAEIVVTFDDDGEEKEQPKKKKSRIETNLF